MEKLDLTKILKDVPNGTKLYSTVHGVVTFAGIHMSDAYPIQVESIDGEVQEFTSEGLYIFEFDGECILFPSKDNRDWSTFYVKKQKYDFSNLKPFDKVIVRDIYTQFWQVGFFGYYNANSELPFYCVGNNFKQCIPYNDDTKHLIGTKEEAPEFYITWE